MSEPMPITQYQTEVAPTMPQRISIKKCVHCGMPLGYVGIDERGYYLQRPNKDRDRGDVDVHCEACGEYTPWEYRRTKLPPFMARQRQDWEGLKDEQNNR